MRPSLSILKLLTSWVHDLCSCSCEPVITLRCLFIPCQGSAVSALYSNVDGLSQTPGCCTDGTPRTRIIIMAHLEPRFSVVPGVIIGWVLKVRSSIAAWPGADRREFGMTKRVHTPGCAQLSRQPSSGSCGSESDRLAM